MSQPPAPQDPYGSPYGSPYGGSPQQPPHQPPGGPPQLPPPGGSGMSNKAKFWIGVVLALPAAFVSLALVGFATAIPGPDGSSTLGGIISGLLSLGLLVGVIVGIVLPRTRWFALGLIAGVAIMAILAAGACIVILVALTNAYQ